METNPTPFILAPETDGAGNMTDNDVQRILAYEYGRLDAKHEMGYSPRPGYESEYSAGYRSESHSPAPEVIPSGTYTHQANWGWY